MNHLRRFVPMLAVVAACNAAPSHEHAVAAVPAPAPAPAMGVGEHAGHQGHEGHETPAPASPPSGFAPVMVAPEQANAMGVALATVEARDLDRALRTTGVVTVDETRTAHVHTKVRGWIEGVRASFTGKTVKPGEALCSIYSQEVLAAELEYLSILERPVIAQGEFAQQEVTAHKQLLDASRRRFSLWDVGRGEIARLEATKQPGHSFAVSSPRGGVILRKDVIDGMFVEPSMELYTIADLSKVWVLADVYESDVPFVHVGDHAHLHVEGTAEPVHAAVTFLPPSVDEATRTLKVRFEIDNEKGAFRPGAFVDVAMDIKMGRGLAIPDSAVIRTGTRAIVFVAEGDRMLKPREVVLGPSLAHLIRVESGLVEGERVAVGAQFLIDAESRLSATSEPRGGHVH